MFERLVIKGLQFGLVVIRWLMVLLLQYVEVPKREL